MSILQDINFYKLMISIACPLFIYLSIFIYMKSKKSKTDIPGNRGTVRGKDLLGTLHRKK